MNDPTGHDPLAFWLAHAHPVAMLFTLLLAGLALRAGLTLRRARQRRVPPDPGARRRHLRLAKPAVVLAVLGLVTGPLSMLLLRGRDPFGTAHAFVATTAALLFAVAGLLGWRIERGKSRARDAHALVAILALLAGGAAFATGFVLLP